MTADTKRVGYKAVEILNTCKILSSITTIISTVIALQIAEMRWSESFSKSKIRLLAKFIICHLTIIILTQIQFISIPHSFARLCCLYGLIFLISPSFLKRDPVSLNQKVTPASMHCSRISSIQS